MRILSLHARALLVLATAGIVSSAGCAEGPPRRGGPNGGPPPQAIEACSMRGANEACYFEDGRHAISGTCQERGNDWVCVPDRGPPGGRSSGDAAGAGPGVSASMAASGRRPPPSDGQQPAAPPEALDACRGLDDGMRCLVQTRRGDIEGRCSFSDDRLACIPADRSYRPMGDEGRAPPGRE